MINDFAPFTGDTTAERAAENTAPENTDRFLSDDGGEVGLAEVLEKTVSVYEVVDDERNTLDALPKKALRATVSTPYDSGGSGEPSEEPREEEPPAEAPTPLAGGGSGKEPPAPFFPGGSDEYDEYDTSDYSEGEPEPWGYAEASQDTDEVHMDDLPTFRELNGGPHIVARTAVNAKLCKMAKVELGLTSVERATVPDDKVDWDTEFPDYNPTFIDLPRGNTSFRKEGDRPDPADPAELEDFDSLEVYEVQRDQHQRPLNPQGRTGLQGRGMLDKWGPTQAADPIVTRNNPETGELETLLIKRETPRSGRYRAVRWMMGKSRGRLQVAS
ncbi:MAG TPA: hypothetical protein VLF60_00985 [Candidatus Saccharimonadales bacterium]|nr:hypothetical protein [Candidatus Saccharimonadales bacterium]